MTPYFFSPSVTYAGAWSSAFRQIGIVMTVARQACIFASVVLVVIWLALVVIPQAERRACRTSGRPGRRGAFARRAHATLIET